LGSNKFIDEKLDYIRNNLVQNEIVDQAEEYLYSSTRDYSGKKGLIGVELM
jgi:hypothetical protein